MYFEITAHSCKYRDLICSSTPTSLTYYLGIQFVMLQKFKWRNFFALALKDAINCYKSCLLRFGAKKI